jgi:poly-gamma-glutamate synthesis protein (capsule biosynthesis protein)
MHPANVPCLTAAHVDCCVLANNHVLDYGHAGLRETLDTLHGAGLRTAGAGLDLREARAPAVIDVPGTARVIVLAFGSETSGIPASWAASPRRPGVHLLADLSTRTLAGIRRMVEGIKRTCDVVVASVHWGSNWGFEVPGEHVEFARGLVRAGVDVVHGHSSHHVRPIEVFEDRLILYGCGDFIDDYEGIPGHEALRDDLALMYFPVLDARTGRLVDLHLTPMRIRNFRATRASPDEARWLRDTISRESRRFGVRLDDRDRGLGLV